MNRIKFLREEKEIYQKDLAKLLNVSVPAINYYENEKRSIDTKTALILAEYFNVSIDYLLGKSDVRNGIVSNIKIPVLGIVKAGYDYLADENVIGYISSNDNRINGDEFFALKVKGTSMIPELYENDIVIVKKQSDFDNGDYVVALINGEEATIKTGYKTEDGLLLKPANNSVDTLKFTQKEIETLPVRIIGVVYDMTRSFKK